LQCHIHLHHLPQLKITTTIHQDHPGSGRNLILVHLVADQWLPIAEKFGAIDTENILSKSNPLTMSKDTVLKQLLIERAYNPAHEPESEQVVFRIQFQNIGSLGNFDLITGRPKSGKSKYLSGMMAAAITRQEIFSMSLRLPEDKKRVAHWDTEQNRYDYHAMIKLVCKLGNIDTMPTHFHSFHCRQDNAATIIAMVDYFLSLYPDTGLLFLDGLLDMIDRFNDEGQSKMLVNFLKKITDQYNVLVIGVLHRGVTHDKSLGHVGSIADRAAQSVLIVEKNKEAKQYVLKAEYLRSADDFEPIAIYYNKQLNFWEQTDYLQPDQPAERQRKKRPAEYDHNDHAANVARIFSIDQLLPYKKYIQNICETYALGHNLAKDMGSYLVREGLVWKTNDGYTNIRQSQLFIKAKN